MAGDVTIVKVGSTPEEQAKLLEAAGVNRATIRQCLRGELEGSPDAKLEPAPVTAQGPKQAVVIPRVEPGEFGNKTPIDTQARPLRRT